MPSDKPAVTPAHAVYDPGLSAKAKGLLVVLIADQANGVTTTITHLVESSSDGLGAVHSGLEELERAGYLTREQVRSERTSRYAGTRYTLHLDGRS